MKKKIVKGIAGAAIGAGAGVLAASAVMYESVLNMKLNRLVQKTGLFTNKEEAKFWAENEIYLDGIKWYREIKPSVLTVDSRIGREAFADCIPAADASHKWAIVIHGYSAGTESMSHYAWKYNQLGYNVILPHMVGHDNDFSVHKQYYTSMGYYDKSFILDWIDYVVAQDSEAEIILHGVSMGSATTMLTTGEDLPDNVKAAVADCGYTSCWDEYAAQTKAMFRLPTFPILDLANAISKLRGNFDFKKCAPIEAVAKSKTPTVFVHGEDDDFVPYEMMEPLYNACSAEKEMLTIPGSFHANAVFAGNELYWNTVLDFIGKYVSE